MEGHEPSPRPSIEDPIDREKREREERERGEEGEGEREDAGSSPRNRSPAGLFIKTCGFIHVSLRSPLVSLSSSSSFLLSCAFWPLILKTKIERALPECSQI